MASLSSLVFSVYTAIYSELFSIYTRFSAAPAFLYPPSYSLKSSSSILLYTRIISLLILRVGPRFVNPSAAATGTALVISDSYIITFILLCIYTPKKL